MNDYFSASVTGINTLVSKKFAWKINDLSTENLLDPVLNYTELFCDLIGAVTYLQQDGSGIGITPDPPALRQTIIYLPHP